MSAKRVSRRSLLALGATTVAGAGWLFDPLNDSRQYDYSQGHPLVPDNLDEISFITGHGIYPYEQVVGPNEQAEFEIKLTNSGGLPGDWSRYLWVYDEVEEYPLANPTDVFELKVESIAPESTITYHISLDPADEPAVYKLLVRGVMQSFDLRGDLAASMEVTR